MTWPTEDKVEEFFGEPGVGQGFVNLPYPMKLSWMPKKTINKFMCHIKVKDSLERIYQKVLDEYGLEEIDRLGLNIWGGCFNYRNKRGGSNLSMHSWGIAVDHDPNNNKLKWNSDKAKFAGPEYDKWWNIWEEEGWTSLGRKQNYDWMHVEAISAG